MSNSKKIRKIMEMVDNVATDGDDFYNAVWKLTEYGVPENIIEELTSKYDSHGEDRWQEGWSDCEKDRAMQGQEF